MGCPFGPSLWGAANMDVLGAGIVEAPGLVLKVGTGLAGIVVGVVTAAGMVTVAGVCGAAVGGAIGAAVGIGAAIAGGVTGGAGTPNTEGVGAGAGVTTAGA